MSERGPAATVFTFPGPFEDIDNHYQERGWTDGLPIVPPTETRVHEFLKQTTRDPREVVGVLPPRQGEATIEKIAVNAVQAGYNSYGQGVRANVTIGRAVRLVLMNIGGGLPGRGDRATQGTPAKIAYCVAENEAESPWEPLHVEAGLPADR